MSPDHKIEEKTVEGMPPETAAEELLARRTTNAFRKECWRCRTKVYVSTREKKAKDKIPGLTFKQLCTRFDRSFRVRFSIIPNRMKSLAARAQACAGALATLGEDDEDARVKLERSLVRINEAIKFCQFISEQHGESLARVNAEIARRHAKHINTLNYGIHERLAHGQ